MDATGKSQEKDDPATGGALEEDQFEEAEQKVYLESLYSGDGELYED